MKKNLVIDAAHNEVLNQTFGITQQYLSVHTVEQTNGQPKVEKVDEDLNDGCYVVYFPIKEQNYYLAITVDTVPKVSVRWVHMEPGTRVYLVVCSDEMSLETLINKTGLRPNEVWRKGDQIRGSTKHKNSGFIFEPNSNKAGQLEGKLDRLLYELELVKSKINTLGAELEISISYYGYKEEMWGWHIDPLTLKRISELNVSVDLDLYACGPDLPD